MIKILAIDDVMDNLLVIEAVLQNYFEDCQISLVTSGREGIELAMKERPDIILLDVKMPGMDGYEVCRILKGNPSTTIVPVILLSAVDKDSDSYVKGLTIGADAFLRKPIDDEELITQVKVALRLKKSEDILRHNKEKLQLEVEQVKNLYEELFNNVNDAIFICDLKGRIIEVNSMGCEYFEQPKGAILNLKFFKHVEGSELKDFVKKEEQSEEKRTQIIESVLLLAGRRIPVEINAALIEFNGGPALLAACRDISGRKRAEEELHEARAFLQSIIESMHSAIIVIDEEGIVRLYNKRAEQFFKKKDDEIPGKGLDSFIPELEVYLKICRTEVETKKAFYMHRESFKDARLEGRIFNISLFPLDFISSSNYMVIKIDDITQYERMEQQLVQAQKMDTIGSLAGGLAHDFNNILTGINTAVSLIRLDMERGEEIDYNEYISTIESSGKRAADIVKQLLLLSKKNKASFSMVELNNCINNVAKICNNSFDKSVHLKLEFGVDNPVIRADLTQLEQVILNIALNGAHSMTIMRADGESWGGELLISTKHLYADKVFCLTHPVARELDYITVTVRDQGVGMSREIRNRIFEPFYTTKDKGQGTGLGLSMVYNIVKQHEGFIEVYSEEGKGSTFSIYLPQYKVEGGRSEMRRGQKELVQGEGGILIIDDEEIVRKLSKSILQKCGYTVFSTDNGYEGLEILKREDIRLILLDVSMPDISGEDTLSKIKEVNSRVKVVMTSGYARDERINNLIEHGVDAFIEKPFNVRQLSEIVQKTLADGE